MLKSRFWRRCRYYREFIGKNAFLTREMVNCFKNVFLPLALFSSHPVTPHAARLIRTNWLKKSLFFRVSFPVSCFQFPLLASKIVLLESLLLWIFPLYSFAPPLLVWPLMLSPSSVYRSTELFKNLWPEMQSDNDSAIEVCFWILVFSSVSGIISHVCVFFFF